MIAVIGQNEAQAPHFIHFLGSIFALPFTILIALTGQIETQDPHVMHLFGSTILTPLFLSFYSSNKLNVEHKRHF